MRVYPPELDFPDTEKPYVESIRGRLVPKMSPKRIHAALEIRVGMALLEWAGRDENVGGEWRFYMLSGRERPSSLVPDVAYVSSARMRDLTAEEREKTPFAPDIAVEIWSPGDKVRDLEEKIEIYFAHGAKLVIVIDPEKSTIAMHEAGAIRAFGSGEIATSAAYPDLRLDVSDLLRPLR